MSTNSPARAAATILILLVIGVASTIGILWWRQGVPMPSAQLARQPFEVGIVFELALSAEAERGDLDDVTVRMLQGDLDRTVFEAKAIGGKTFLDTVRVNLAGEGLREGEALLEIHVRDTFWRPRGGNDEPALRIPVLIDLTPPQVSVRAATRYPAAGGAAVAVVSADGAKTVEVEAGHRRFIGHPVKSGEEGAATRYAILYALAIDHPASDMPTVIATDAAGNETRAVLPVVLRDPRIPEGSVNLSTAWLREKLPALVPHRLPLEDSELTDAFLEVSRDQRAQAAARREELARASNGERKWAGSFLQLPNSVSTSAFGVRRTYRIGGEPLDTQVHQGYDLASTEHAPIPAANAGQVVFAGPLTLYGNAVILDHGWGLMTLYGHCSSLEVEVGQTVERGQTIARTGQTGLAGGDHLHFEVIVGGQPVTPIQWFDRNWIRDHVDEVLKDGGVNF